MLHILQEVRGIYKTRNHLCVYIDGNLGTILYGDKVSDGCFIEVPQLAPAVQQVGGPLLGLTPRRGEQCDFERIASGRITTIITAWDHRIPWMKHPLLQLTVDTDPDTLPGDSGSALIDNNRCIVGFAFLRSGISNRWGFSSWIWAESVWDALGLQ